MTDVARTHGGDGGHGPPRRNPDRLPSACESSRPKKRRSKGKNLKLYKKYEKNNNQPLHIDVDTTGETYKFVGENSSDFTRLIFIEISRIVPFYYPSWLDVPSKFKDAIWPTLFQFFNLERFRQNQQQWEKIQLGILAECQNAYRNRKKTLKQHFDSVGGYADIEKAKSQPAEDVDPDEWIQIIDDLFSTSEYRNRSEKNKLNRAKQKYPSYHGTQSYAQKLHMELPGYSNRIEGFKTSHSKNNKWANDIARSDGERLTEEATRMGMGSRNLSSLEQVQCLQNVLGPRRGHMKGVGRVIRRGTPNVPSTSQQQIPEFWQKQMERMEQEMQSRIAQQLEEQLEEQLNKHLDDQWEKMQQDVRKDVRKKVRKEVRKEVQKKVERHDHQDGSESEE